MSATPPVDAYDRGYHDGAVAQAAAADADEIVALRKQNAELKTILAKIAEGKGFDAAMAKSALDTIRLLNERA